MYTHFLIIVKKYLQKIIFFMDVGRLGAKQMFYGFDC
jgi:hypothetical protein